MIRFLVLLLLLGASSARAQEPPPPLRVNSFLVEEAYTQEEGVVEHINALRISPDGAWEYSFTQEWPLFSPRHQIAFTLPLQRKVAALGGAMGVGDVEVSYGYQLLGDERSKLFVSPRLGVALPTGEAGEGRGAGAPGMEAGLPVSITVSRNLVTSWNVGASYTPSARNARGEEADLVGYGVGGSLIWMTRPDLGLILGAVWESTEEVDGPGEKSRSSHFLVAPGIRAAINLPSGLQIVPAVAVPIGLGPGSGERAVLLFLSVEHPFKRQPR